MRPMATTTVWQRFIAFLVQLRAAAKRALDGLVAMIEMILFVAAVAAAA